MAFFFVLLVNWSHTFLQGLTFRRATAHDYDKVVSLMRQLNPDDPQLNRKAGMGIFRNIVESQGNIIFIADLDGQPVSSCYLNVIPNLTRGGQAYALLENVVTDTAHQRMGIGSELLKHAIVEAFNKGCYKVMLLTGRNQGVHTFYQNCGMEKNSKTAFIVRK